MIKLIWSKIIKWAWDHNHGQETVLAATPTMSDIMVVDGLSFNVMPAQGGTVVQIRHYDRKTDRDIKITHVIPDGEDIARAIGHIVSMELLRS